MPGLIDPDPLHDLDARVDAANRRRYLTRQLNQLLTDLQLPLSAIVVEDGAAGGGLQLTEDHARKVIRRLEEIGDIVIPAEAANTPQPGEGQLALEL
jgi:hypothetical protein